MRKRLLSKAVRQFGVEPKMPRVEPNGSSGPLGEMAYVYSNTGLLAYTWDYPAACEVCGKTEAYFEMMSKIRVGIVW